MSQPPQFPQESGAYPETSQATTILVLGIIGIILCQVLGPIAWVMGNNELAAINAGRRAPENRGTANAGRILGIIGTVLLALSILAVIFLVVGVLSLDVFESTT